MAKRTYSDGSIEVLWDSSLCVHSGRCTASLPDVFDTSRRPWIQLSGVADEIARVIENCPSGALRYNRLDGGPAEQPDATVSIVPWPNGPLYVRGDFSVEDAHGGTFSTAYRASLCRCGHTQNAPFCDMSHRNAGFRSAPKAPDEE